MSVQRPQVDERRVAQLLDKLLFRAKQERASDIHLEPNEQSIRVRFRIDGLLADRPSIPGAFRSVVTTRLKVQANLDISEKRLPQDGAFTVQNGKQTTSYRVSTFPTHWGEKIVLRVLGGDGLQLDLAGLGMETEMRGRLENALSMSNGIVLVTGPTGSGKTSTLYAMIRSLENTQTNICTLEDPVEYQFQNITQGQTALRSGFTFAKGLRALLRQDPDIIMVGEMRDVETASIAFRAALTGHLVLSSLHTNSGPETVVRLIDMGLERYVVGSALRAVVSQRLVRSLCEACKAPVVPDEATRILLKVPPHRTPEVFEEKGCPRCAYTGFAGRTGVFEVLEVDEVMSEMIKQEASTRKEYELAMARRGMTTLRRAGLQKVLEGRTTVGEVLRVC